MIPVDGSPFGELETVVEPEGHGRGMDMCNINLPFLGKTYRYAYICGARRQCNFSTTLTKIDLLEKMAKKKWHEEGVVPRSLSSWQGLEQSTKTMISLFNLFTVCTISLFIRHNLSN
jgi:hypothetical protein